MTFRRRKVISEDVFKRDFDCLYSKQVNFYLTYSISGVVGVLPVLGLLTKRSAGTEILRLKSVVDGGPNLGLRCLLWKDKKKL